MTASVWVADASRSCLDTHADMDSSGSEQATRTSESRVTVIDDNASKQVAKVAVYTAMTSVRFVRCEDFHESHKTDLRIEEYE